MNSKDRFLYDLLTKIFRSGLRFFIMNELVE